MNANLLKKELKMGRSNFLIWMIVIELLTLMTMAMFSTMAGTGGLMESYVALFPEGMMNAFGMSPASFTNVVGFYSVYNVFYAVLLGSMYAMMLGSGIILKERGQGTAEFLLSKPLTRLNVAMTKTAVFLIFVFVLNVIMWGVGSLALEIFKGETSYEYRDFLVMSVYSLLMILFFGSLGLFMSVLWKKKKTITGTSVGIVLGAYLLDAVTKGFDKIKKIGIISPFRWADLDVLRPGYALEFWRVAVLLGPTVVFLVLTHLIYRRKDIYL